MTSLHSDLGQGRDWNNFLRRSLRPDTLNSLLPSPSRKPVDFLDCGRGTMTDVSTATAVLSQRFEIVASNRAALRSLRTHTHNSFTLHMYEDDHLPTSCPMFHNQPITQGSEWASKAALPTAGSCDLPAMLLKILNLPWPPSALSSHHCDEPLLRRFFFSLVPHCTLSLEAEFEICVTWFISPV